MTSNFLDDIRAECPQCGHKDFSGLPEPKLDDVIVCSGCGLRVRLEDAVSAGLEKALVQELTKDGTFKR